ncbi:trehalase isoform X2 [Athalia rosae]|uniref:trehalase isoform X2 n=1 Tax=Athalia rosae TaxID=37344 RepID=UPI0020335121|nr:trehalase isoform X2 [Athalia rosae]
MVPTINFTNVSLLIIGTLISLASMGSAATAVYDPDEENFPPSCDSPVYCHGNLLHTVQMAAIYTDSKTFVDTKMKYELNETLRLFDEFMERTGGAPSRSQVEIFVNDTFDPPNSELEVWAPTDWVENPKFLDDIRDPILRQFAADLNHVWKLLGRKMKEEIKEKEELYSIIYVPNPVIVPGGRFREFYYWDSYWIIKGLLYSEMHTTARGMISNLVSVVEKVGHIPNGGRVYYKRRSHPPLLIMMVKAYLDFTNDENWLAENMWLLEKEFQYWMTNHTITVEKDGTNYTLARYYEKSTGPRPESYREDYESAQIFTTQADKERFYRELKSAAESGWDFSSRWFVSEGTNKGNLTHTKSTNIIPVELNSILYGNAMMLAEFSERLGNSSRAEEYLKIADQWRKAVTAVLWHEEVGVWLDYDIANEIERDYFYPTNIAPLWTFCFDRADAQHHVSKVMKYLEKTQIMINYGGMPSTLEHTGEQWDYPNAWAPLQYIMIVGLNNTGDPWAQKLAYELAERWVRGNQIAFNETGHMFEKYDATVLGGHGSGGEYEVQLGFGWSNGVVLELMQKYGSQMTARDEFEFGNSGGGAYAQQPSVSSMGQLLTGILVLIISLATGFIGYWTDDKINS